MRHTYLCHPDNSHVHATHNYVQEKNDITLSDKQDKPITNVFITVYGDVFDIRFFKNLRVKYFKSE